MGLLDGTTQNNYYQGGDFGNYQFTSLDNIITQFQIAYVGEGKIIQKIKRADIAFHAQRGLQEFSFDTFKSCKSQEIELPATLQMPLPHDYINYTKISWVDSAGIKHLMYPTSKTSNPTNPLQNNDGDFKLNVDATFTVGSRYLVLDKEYSNIKVGMRVVSPHTPAPSNEISNIQTDGSVTTIELYEGTILSNLGTAFNSLITGTVTVEIQNTDGSIFQSPTTYAANNVTSTTNGYIITVSSTDASNIEVGMIVAGSTVEYIEEGTTVVAINGNNITVSNEMKPLYSTGTTFDVNFISPISDSDTWSSYKSATPSENQDDYQDDTYWKMNGNRYGLNPQHAQVNGSFYIDRRVGNIHFSSNISGKTVILDYISDSLGTDEEMQVHKFAEEAMYKYIAYAILSTSSQPIHQQLAPRFKKERFAETRKAKLRLSNIKLEELTQILRGKSKQIKH